jgi:glycosyltransferase involved in cell wall biosynthesis
MRIGHYEHNVYAQGGTATYIRRLGQAQKDRGHTVVYLSQTPPPGTPSSGTPSFGEPSFGEPSLGEPPLGGRPDPAHVPVTSEADLFAQAARLQLDVLHLHQPVGTLPDDRVVTVRTMHNHSGSCVSGSRLLGRSSAPCNRAVHPLGCLWGHYVNQCGPRDPRRLWANVANVRRELKQGQALHTFAVSAFLRDRMLETGYPPDRVHALRSPAPPPADSFAPPPSDGAPRFLFLGRLVNEKGAAWLLQAAARVEGPLHVDIAGAGPLQDALQRTACALGMSRQVTFHGWCSPDRVAALLAQARAVVVPSVWHEPAGLVTLEAAAAGRAVVASRVGGIPEYARPAFARRVPPNDVDALAAALQDLADHPDTACRMGRQGQTLARSIFSMDTFLDRQFMLYERAGGPTVSCDRLPAVPPP